jgi:hypothetical protein
MPAKTYVVAQAGVRNLAATWVEGNDPAFPSDPTDIITPAADATVLGLPGADVWTVGEYQSVANPYGDCLAPS